MPNKSKPKPVAKLGLLDRIMRKIFRAEDIMPRERTAEDIKFWAVIRVFAASVRKFPTAFAIACITSIAAALIGIYLPTLVRELVDSVKFITKSTGGIDRSYHIAYVILGFGIAYVVAQRSTFYAMNSLAKNVMEDLYRRMYSSVLRQEYRFFSNTSSGALFQKINRFPMSYDALMDRFIFTLIPLLITVVGTIVILLHEKWQLALVIIIWASSFISYSVIAANWKARYDLVRASEDSKTGATIADLVTNQFAIDTCGAHAEAMSRFDYSVGRKVHTMAFGWNTGVTLWGLSSFMVRFAEFAIYTTCIWLYSKGELTEGLMFQSILYVRMLTEHLNEVDRMIREVYEQLANASEAVQILMRTSAVIDAPHVKDIVVSDGCVSFKDVCFAIDERMIIRGVSLEVRSGESIAFVGKSGAGKSTLTKLLMRLYDIDFGHIKIDDQDISKVTLKSLRSKIACIPQDSSLFTRSIMENIRFGSPNASDDQVLIAARLAHCDEFVLRMPRGYDTPVGDRGVKLSGGERQRVAIARALLRNAPILICDEATSALDSESEAHIKAAFAEVTRGRTTFFIAHRLSTIMDVDRIVVIDEGQIAEMGTHDELVFKGGIYADLWRRQQEGFVPGPSESSELPWNLNAIEASDDELDDPLSGLSTSIVLRAIAAKRDDSHVENPGHDDITGG